MKKLYSNTVFLIIGAFANNKRWYSFRLIHRNNNNQLLMGVLKRSNLGGYLKRYLYVDLVFYINDCDQYWSNYGVMDRV
jgi:hypothetical protein